MDILHPIDVVGLAEHPQHLETVLEWYMREWPAAGGKQVVTQRLYGAGLRDQLPLTLLALSESIPVGFISLIFYEQGLETGRLHWVDALYTNPRFRRRGVASHLLRIGEERAIGLGIKDLYALTDEVSLYEHNGWMPVKETTPGSSRDVVMQRRIRTKNSPCQARFAGDTSLPCRLQ